METRKGLPRGKCQSRGLVKAIEIDESCQGGCTEMHDGDRQRLRLPGHGSGIRPGEAECANQLATAGTGKGWKFIPCARPAFGREGTIFG